MKLTKLIKSVIVLISLFFVNATHAAPTESQIPYYGDEFYDALKAGQTNQDLEVSIKKVLRSYHVRRPGQNDLVVKSCAQAQGQGRCYAHQPIGYTAARLFLMGNYYLVNQGTGYAVHDVYCDADRPQSDFRKAFPAPGVIPDNTVVNVEHTWPQSHFTRRFPDETQKSDLHHLFPTDSQLNAIRGNNMFGEVTQDMISLRCPGARFGLGSAGSGGCLRTPSGS